MAATDDVAAVAPDPVDLDFNIDDFDVRDLDLDFDFGDQLAADEFCDAYSAFVANADAQGVGGGAASAGWLAGLCVGGDEASRSGMEGTPESGLTDDGALARDEAMSAYVAELERFMMAEEEPLCPAADFIGDLLAASDPDGAVVTAAAAAAAAAGALHNGEQGNSDDDVLAAREEDEPTSRKRARHKIKGTTMAPWWAELEVTRRHLARIQVPALPWPPAASALLCCNM
ncbi:hypothetical protein PVAP13_7NG243300 [Panicum virgatum]|nr:hypothetical protein PVAP13_7NG243300 [Panicum virgatum]